MSDQTPKPTATPTSQPQGVFIVIEGTEGSGKAIQLRVLADQLTADGHDVAMFDLPQYTQASSYFVKKYRQGDYGDSNLVDPYTASLFYVLDQFDAADKIRQALDSGKVVLCNHFSASNMVLQGIKLPDVEKRRGFYIWLDNLAFETLKMPRPNLNIFLRVPAELSRSKLVDAYDDLVKLFPKDFSRIDCVRSGELLSNEAIGALVREKAYALLPEADKTQVLPEPAGESLLASFIAPDGLNSETGEQYAQTITAILETQSVITKKLAAHLSDQKDGNKQAQQLSRAVLPLAANPNHQLLDVATVSTGGRRLRSLLDKYLPVNHNDGHTQSVTLVAVWPRNEIDLIIDMLYGLSDLSLKELRQQADSWSYDQKLAVFAAGNRAKTALAKASYTWDIVASCEVFNAMPQNDSTQWQQLTPRLGYDVPDIIEDAGLTDEYDACFDASLKLYSQLQQQLPQESQLACYAVLSGHRMRWQVTYDGNEMLELFTASCQPQTQLGLGKLASQMRAELTEVHPLVSQAVNMSA